MSIFELIILIIFVTFSLLLAALSVSALQLIKVLKISLVKINKLLDNPQNLPKEPLKKFEETISFQASTKPNPTPHLFRRQK